MHYIVWAVVFFIRINISIEKRFVTLEHKHNAKYEYHGVFDNFAKELLEIMIKPQPSNRMAGVLESFYQQLNLIHNPYTKLLSKWFLYLKSMSYEQRKTYLQIYRAAMRKKQTALLDFFRAINNVLSTKSRNLNTLLLKLRQYFEKDVLIDINVEIRAALRVIYSSVKVLNSRRQKYILARMRLALKEFNDIDI